MDPRLRRTLGPAYPVLMRLKSSPAAGIGKALPGAVPYWLARRRGGDTIGLDLRAPMGMGALIAHAILYHAHFEREGTALRVRSGNPLYSQGGEDVLAAFFEREPWPADLRPLSPAAEAFVLAFVRLHHLPLAEARRIMARHFRPNARLREAIAGAAGEDARFDLSIHFRATDKYLESGRVTHQRMFAALDPHLDGRARPHVFLATDEPAFAAAARARYPQARWSTFTLGEVEDGTPRHFSSLSPEAKATEALVNIHLLARAPLCVRTSSYLSAISALVNPQLRTVTISRTLAKRSPFPEHEILQAEQAGADRSHPAALRQADARP